MLTDQKFELHPGEGLIMNAGQLHRVIPRQQKSGILVCLNLSPSASVFAVGRIWIEIC